MLDLSNGKWPQPHLFWKSSKSRDHKNTPSSLLSIAYNVLRKRLSSSSNPIHWSYKWIYGVTLWSSSPNLTSGVDRNNSQIYGYLRKRDQFQYNNQLLLNAVHYSKWMFISDYSWFVFIHFANVFLKTLMRNRNSNNIFNLVLLNFKCLVKLLV